MKLGDNMLRLNYEQPQKIHFIGIGGISMSGLAQILLHHGFTVTGSDVSSNDQTKQLEDLGATIYRGHHADHITSDIDMIIYTVAVKLDNVELVKATELGIPIYDRAALLGVLFSDYTNSIAVSGTHGKTTTTSMVAHILEAARLDATISIGGSLPLIQGNIKVGSSSYFVSEACEYYDSFLKFFPKIGIILNVEADHLDYFEDIDHIRRSFTTFIEQVPADGLIVINDEIEDYKSLLVGAKSKVMTYGIDHPTRDYTAMHITYNDLGFPHFEVYEFGVRLGSVELQVPGLHNVSNALAAIAAGRFLNLGLHDICNGLYHFTGTHRRFEYKGSLAGVKVVDDYAHHPTEIEATINATKNMTYNKLWVVFQPHTYTRTKSHFDEFARTLALADSVILLDIYSAARETDPGDIHSSDLKIAIEALGTPCSYFASFDEAEIFILENCIPNDLLITMGAGDVHLVGERLLQS